MAAWLVVLAMCSSCSAQLVWPEEGVRRCSWTVTHGMKGFLCSGMDLKDVPPHLSTSIELLDLSSNRIRSLSAEPLSRYSYLRYLYLNDNLIVKVEEGAFSALQLLEAVDLSLNALHQVPPSLVRLPALRRLYFADNLLGLTASTGLEGPPPDSQLHFLSLARCGLADLPPLHGFKKLHTLNVSGNSLSNLTVAQVAPLCRLAVLDLTRNSRLLAQPEQLCDCVLLDEWLADKGIKLAGDQRLKCGGEYVPGKRPQECQGDDELSSAEEEHQTCDRQLVALEQTARARKAWSTAGICVGVAAAVALVALIVWLRRRRRARVAQHAAAHRHNHKPLLQQQKQKEQRRPPEPGDTDLEETRQDDAAPPS